MKIWMLAPLLFLLPHLSAAQVGPSLEKIRIAYSAIGGSQSAVWIPYEAGIFRKHGLDVELLYVMGGGRAAQIVQSGEVPIGTFTGGAVVNSNLAGGDLATIAAEMNVMPFFLVVRPEIQRLEDLKGKRIGITRFGSATDFALLYAEQKWPVKRGRDFTVVQMGGHPEMLAALRSRALDGVLTNPEFNFQARKEGFKELVDISTLGLNFPTSSINTTRAFIRRNENAIRKFVRSFVEGMHFAKTQRAFSIEVFKKYLRSNDMPLLNDIYDLYVLRYHPKVPYPTREPIQTVLNQMADKDPRAAAAKPEQFIEPRFVEELEKEGFIQQLWK